VKAELRRTKNICNTEAEGMRSIEECTRLSNIRDVGIQKVLNMQ
jgi:hypothetical protein